MRVEVRRSTHASTDDLWALVGDLENWATIVPTMRRVIRVTGHGPIDVGDRFQVEQPGLSTTVYEITDWRAGRSFRWQSSTAGIRTTATHGLDESTEGADLVLTLEWSGSLAWLARLLIGSKVRRMVEQEADAFVRRAERGS